MQIDPYATRSHEIGVSEAVDLPIPSMRPYFTNEDVEELSDGFKEILRSGRLTLGKYTSEFERQFADYIGVKHAIAANSGTSTLEMIYRAIGVEGKEVIVPTNTHIATSNAVLYAGGRPILSDIEKSSLCLDAEDAFSKVTERTRALVVVHIAGLIHPRIDEIRERCEQLGIVLVEDAAHAHGATRDGKKAGSLSRAASFSFYPAKVITSIEGGMITTDDPEIAKVARQLRNHGSDSGGHQVRLGNNWRMSEVHSMIGLKQLQKIEEILAKKNEVARLYSEILGDEESLNLIEIPPNTRHSYYKFPVTLSRMVNVGKLQISLKETYRIETGTIYYPPCHLQPVYKQLFKTHEGMLPVSEDVLKRTIALPIYAGMERPEASYVAESLLSALHDQSDTVRN
ncbi:MAG TPA: DegT/DnrJ/EryC1/StrS family aminotransferase [Nitrososphaerales archaeon]|nr:DegT/DnrJ/EryC1/StrS family aminotransferase [Nitrososphaerales archaeon]